jgi:hypothetical protein
MEVSVYIVKHGEKKIKKVKISTLLDYINMECFSKKFFMTKKEAIKYEKENNHRSSKT